MKKPKILIYDIETAGVGALYADLGFVVVFGYKWLGEKKTHSLTFDKFGGYIKHGYSDKGILQEASKLFQEADLVVGHYNDFFDNKFVNGRLMVNKLPPLPPTKSVDVVKLLWKYAKFHSNRLKAIGNTLKLEKRKRENGWPDWWFKVLAGDIKTLEKMAKYCRGDVAATEEEYLRVRPFHAEHIHMYTERASCAMCGSKNINYRGTYRTKKKTHRQFQCKDCGKWGHDPQAIKEKT